MGEAAGAAAAAASQQQPPNPSTSLQPPSLTPPPATNNQHNHNVTTLTLPPLFVFRPEIFSSSSESYPSVCTSLRETSGGHHCIAHLQSSSLPNVHIQVRPSFSFSDVSLDSPTSLKPYPAVRGQSSCRIARTLGLISGTLSALGPRISTGVKSGPPVPFSRCRPNVS